MAYILIKTLSVSGLGKHTGKEQSNGEYDGF